METERNRFARRLFSGLGPGYDRLAAALSFGQDPRWRRFLVARAGVPPGGHVLDVATGTGAVAIALARRYRCTVTGLDQSAEMLATGRERVTRAGLSGRVTLQEGRAEQLPFPDAAFDACTFTYLLRYVEDPGATLVELARVLKPGGRIAGLEFGVPAAPLWRAAWRLYTRAGLPLAGRLISPSWYEVGRFLGPSIEEHYRRYPPDRLLAFWRTAGIHDVQARALSLGGGVVTWGVKGDGQPPPRSATTGVLRA
jgi:demethylmenaquinone methyltransferase/2-methoxy-6-polyprenyl-1,4-benzoquinol methylase